MSKKLIFILLAALVTLMPIGSAWAQGGVGPEPTRQPDATDSAQPQGPHPISPPDFSGCKFYKAPRGGVYLCRTAADFEKLTGQKAGQRGGITPLDSTGVIYAPPPSYTCGYGQTMWSSWTLSDDGSSFDYDASYYDRRQNIFGVDSYGPFPRQQGYTSATAFSVDGPDVRYYAHRFNYNGSSVTPVASWCS